MAAEIVSFLDLVDVLMTISSELSTAMRRQGNIQLLITSNTLFDATSKKS